MESTKAPTEESKIFFEQNLGKPNHRIGAIWKNVFTKAKYLITNIEKAVLVVRGTRKVLKRIGGYQVYGKLLGKNILKKIK